MLSNILETEAGVLVVDNRGIGFAQNTPQMAYVCFEEGMLELVAVL